MLQGTGSHVGKSVLVAALCRILRQDGVSVAPFKAQNMSLNSGVTADGREIGRAQMLQAQACGIDAASEMNPILLKPQGNAESQVIVEGTVWKNLSASEYHRDKKTLWPVVERNLASLRSKYDAVIIEGAGSPAEINLRSSDIVNMEVALHAKAPVLLVGDIDRGGVFAWLVGTLDLLAEGERELVAGLIINKFRGDVKLLEPGLSWLTERTGKPVCGVIPYQRSLGLAEEDTLGIPGADWGSADEPSGRLEVVAIRMPRMANFTDFDPLASDSAFNLTWVEPGDPLLAPGGRRPHLIILPGTKTTLADLDVLKSTGVDRQLSKAAADGVTILGICGGYQMLGNSLTDAGGVETQAGSYADGLGLLDIETTFGADKELSTRTGLLASDSPLSLTGTAVGVEGYEIHVGRTVRGSGARPLFSLDLGEAEGAINLDGGVLGTYLHGLFDSPGFRTTLANYLTWRRGVTAGLDFDGGAPVAVEQELSAPISYWEQQENALDRLAFAVRESMDIKLVYELLGLSPDNYGR